MDNIHPIPFHGTQWAPALKENLQIKPSSMLSALGLSPYLIHSFSAKATQGSPFQVGISKERLFFSQRTACFGEFF